MKSTWGRRGMIMEKFGWSLQYVTWEITFAALNRIMADMPWFDYEKDDGKPGKKKQKGKSIKMTDPGFLEYVQSISNSR